MTKRTLLTLLASLPLCAQNSADDAVIKGIIIKEPPAIALPDLRGSGDAQQFMDAFNTTLFADIQDSAAFKMVPKSAYPLEIPQRPTDFKAPVDGKRQGPWLTDWSADPVNASYFTIGYAAAQDKRMVLYGWLYSAKQPDLANAQMLGKLYFNELSNEGARKLAHEFAADILAKFGQKPLFSTRIYFTSNRTGTKEIWQMDWDGSNQKQVTFLKSTTINAAVSPDGSRLAFMTYAKGNPTLMLMSLESGRILPFYNQQASINMTPEFTPDGHLLFASTAHGGFSNIYISNLDGSGIRRLAPVRAVEVQPRVNPKTNDSIVFTSGRSGLPQVYKMNMDGADAVRLSSGEGDAVNAAWHPDGKLIAFSWTAGYEPGRLNIFVMDVATRKYVQLTHDEGKNESPYWAPDGRHIVFTSTRNERERREQIYTMLADGTQVRRLTHEATNEKPVWGK